MACEHAELVFAVWRATQGVQYKIVKGEDALRECIDTRQACPHRFRRGPGPRRRRRLGGGGGLQNNIGRAGGDAVKLYHPTREKHLPSIAEHGLILTSG